MRLAGGSRGVSGSVIADIQASLNAVSAFDIPRPRFARAAARASIRKRAPGRLVFNQSISLRQGAGNRRLAARSPASPTSIGGMRDVYHL
jgi:hypothetical protein